MFWACSSLGLLREKVQNCEKVFVPHNAELEGLDTTAYVPHNAEL